MIFSDAKEAKRAYETDQVSLHAKVHVRITDSEYDKDGELEIRTRRVETTVGRAILSDLLPKGIPFEQINCVMKKRISLI